MARFPFQEDFPMGDRRPDETRVHWICREIRTAIVGGRLLPGARVPPSRTFAKQHGLARGTVSEAFDQLVAEGYLTSRRGSGTTVNQHLPDCGPANPEPSKRTRPATRVRLSQRAGLVSTTPFPTDQSQTAVRAFAANQPSVDHFPTGDWARISSRRLRMASRNLLHSGDPLGYRPLREAVTAHLATTRGVQCTADQVMIVSGTQHALSLVTQLVLDPGDRAWFEDPGYTGAAAVLRAGGANLVPVPVDSQGLRVGDGRRLADDARFAYVTPAHQFPLGAIMAPERRLELLEWARDRGAWIFEDDYDSEFRFTGKPIAALQALTDSSQVIFSGSFNKMLFPALRMGFLVLPDRLVDPMLRVRSLFDRFGPTLEQAVLCDFIADGHFSRHLRRMRQIYGEHQTALLQAAAADLSGLLDIQATGTGLQTTGWLPAGHTDRATASAAARAGIDVVALSDYAIQWPRRDGLQIGFGAVRPAELRSAVKGLARVLENGPG